MTNRLPTLFDSDDALVALGAHPSSPAVMAMCACMFKQEGFPTQRALKHIKKDRATLYTLQRIGRMLNEEQLNFWFLNEDRLTIGHMKSIVATSQDQYSGLMKEVVHERMSCRDLEASIFDRKHLPPTSDASVKSFEADISEHACRDVKIKPKPNGKGGVISFQFFNYDDLENFLLDKKLMTPRQTDY